VTVSACRSAGGRAYAGEGLVGFAWAFLKAGASNVIAGLWDVNDKSTTKLMAGLYKRIGEGSPAADALREAKLDLIRGGGAYAKPFYWAPFQIYTARP
jgi:CHAT domain-containing protein